MLVLSIAYPSPSWEHFLRSLAAKPSTRPEWNPWECDAGQQWEKWCSSQTWHTNILPYLKYLEVHYTKDISLSRCLENSPLFRLVAWTREKLTPPLDYLKVCVGDVVVDYISSGYLDQHLRSSAEDHHWGLRLGAPANEYDWRIVRGMLTRRLNIAADFSPFFRILNSTILFRQLQALEFNCPGQVNILPYLEQIKELGILNGKVPAYSSDIHLPLVHTLHTLRLSFSTVSWMLGRTFTALKKCVVDHVEETPRDLPWWNALQMGMPVCVNLEWKNSSVIFFPFVSCPNLQGLQ